MSTLRAFYTRLMLTWGFTLRNKEASAAQPALILPSPTTIIGAFAYPLFRLLEINVFDGKEEKYEDHRLITPTLSALLISTRVASAGIISKNYLNRYVGLAVHQEIGKLITPPYRSGGGWEEARKTKVLSDDFYKKGLSQALSIQAVGSSYGPGVELELMWVFDAEVLSRKLAIDLDTIDNAAVRAVHGVVRLGSKEGLVTIDYKNSQYEKNVQILEPGSSFKTRLYVEKECVQPVEKYLVNEITLWGLNGKLTNYYVPSTMGSNTLILPLPEEKSPHFTLIEPCRAYKLSNEVVGVGR